MDSLPVHRGEEVQTVMDELDIEVMWAPKYSPDYNPIELVFSQIKALMKRLRL